MTKSLKDAWRSPKFVAGVFVALFFATALCFRVLLPYPAVFGSDWIKYTGIDPYYNMRLVDNLLQNFPHHMSIDPYHIFPGATGEISIRFFVWLLAGVTWLIGLGSPSPHTIDVVGVYFPAVLGALAVIPVYFIGKTLVNRWAGVLGAGLIAIMPGEFLGRSILGFTDY
ncbi:MAG: STT3 domain-containing protein, partial [Chloroflexota bacterium]|nr:STT3 domain-containing protein [Chloroflexota bacterium]